MFTALLNLFVTVLCRPGNKRQKMELDATKRTEDEARHLTNKICAARNSNPVLNALSADESLEFKPSPESASPHRPLEIITSQSSVKFENAVNDVSAQHAEQECFFNQIRHRPHFLA